MIESKTENNVEKGSVESVESSRIESKKTRKRRRKKKKTKIDKVIDDDGSNKLTNITQNWNERSDMFCGSAVSNIQGSSTDLQYIGESEEYPIDLCDLEERTWEYLNDENPMSDEINYYFPDGTMDFDTDRSDDEEGEYDESTDAYSYTDNFEDENILDIKYADKEDSNCEIRFSSNEGLYTGRYIGSVNHESSEERKGSMSERYFSSFRSRHRVFGGSLSTYGADQQRKMGYFLKPEILDCNLVSIQDPLSWTDHTYGQLYHRRINHSVNDINFQNPENKPYEISQTVQNKSIVQDHDHLSDHVNGYEAYSPGLRNNYGETYTTPGTFRSGLRNHSTLSSEMYMNQEQIEKPEITKSKKSKSSDRSCTIL